MINCNSRHVGLQSSGYKSINFNSIIFSSLIKTTDTKQSLCLLLSDYYGYMINENSPSIKIISRGGECQVDHSHIDITYKLVTKSKCLYLVKFKKISDSQLSGANSNYILMLSEIIQNIIMSLKYLSSHVYNHIGKRNNGDLSLINLNMIQNKLSEIILILTKLDVLMNNSSCIFFHNILDDMDKALVILISLSGARSILPNGLMDFVFQLGLFKKLLITGEGII